MEDFMNPPVGEIAPNTTDFMNPPEPTREEVLINNLLSEICNYTDIPLAHYEEWLTMEVGMTEAEIKRLKDVNCFPEPVA